MVSFTLMAAGKGGEKSRDLPPPGLLKQKSKFEK
jgi:hypothetical protein